MMMMAKFIRSGRIRKLHTLISQETIKPSSPTPLHLKTHNLSLLDQLAPNLHMPFVFFYRNYNKGNTSILKQSLSHSLTQYYPFAGRFPTHLTNHIDCNDKGVEFLESSNDCRLDDIIHKKELSETLDQVFPHGLGYTLGNTCPNVIEVQLNHFACGGVAVVMSVAHKAADAYTISCFANHWATVVRGGSPINPSFISSPTTSDSRMPDFLQKATNNYVIRRFVFPNAKLSKLKNKINAMGTPSINPTRVEALTSLLFKCAVGSATTKSGSLTPSNLTQTVNMRNKMVESCPEATAGNIYITTIAKMADSSEIRLNEVIVELRKGKREFEGLRDVKEVGEKMTSKLSTLGGEKGRFYYSSSVCGLPLYDVDFGWGKPVEATIRLPNVDDNVFILIDTPSRDGIEALVNLQEEEMTILQKDNELLAYAEEI